MKKCTKKVICERIVQYMQDNNITNLSMPNPFPVSWRTINSIKASHKKKDRMSFSATTQKKLLDFFDLAHYRDGTDYLIIEHLLNENSIND